MNKIDQKIYNLSRELKCLAKEVCTLSEGNTETDPIFTASPSFGITDTNIGNWNTAFGWGNHSGLYLPIAGGTLTGTGGSGFLGLTNQTTAPTAPANSIRIFSDSSNRLSWKTTSDTFVRTITTTAAITADRVWSFPDSGGEVMVSGPAQTMAGVKTFSSNISHGGNITPTVNGTRLIGSSTFQYGSAYTKAVIGDSLFVGANGSTNLTFGYNGGANTAATLFNGGNFLIQNGGTHTNGGFLLDVTGTTRLNGNTTLGGNILFPTNNIYNIGDSTNKVAVAYINSVLTNAILTLGGVGTTVPILFRQGTGSQLIGGFAATTGSLILQSSAAALNTDDTISRLQVIGKVRISDAPTYADNAAALTGGLIVGSVYKLADGSLKIVI